MVLHWQQTDDHVWQARRDDGKNWQISWGEFSQVYSVCRFDEDSAIGMAAFPTLNSAKRFCETQAGG
jgi:hypothetical protein